MRIVIAQKHKTFATSHDVLTFGLLGFKSKYPFINFGSNNGSLTNKTPTYGKVLNNIELSVFTTEYETLLLIKEIKNFTTISSEAEKRLVFHLEHQSIHFCQHHWYCLFVAGRKEARMMSLSNIVSPLSKRDLLIQDRQLEVFCEVEVPLLNVIH